MHHPLRAYHHSLTTSARISPSSGELYIWEEPIIKLYTDDMGRFPIRSRSGNLYLMLAYH